MPTKIEALQELNRRGLLTGKRKEAYNELVRRGRIPGESPTSGVQAISTRQKFRQQAMTELAEEMGPLETFLTGVGRGMVTVGRGLGLVEPEDPYTQQAMEALRERRPYVTGAGEIVGEAAPFIPAAAVTGGIAPLAGRIVATAGLGGIEAGVIAKGQEKEILPAATTGAAIGASAEILFPVIGRLGRKIFERVTGRVPRGSMLDAAGRPTQELQQALDASNMTFEELTQDATEFIATQRPGARPEQVGRAALFREEGIPVTRGEITRAEPQLTTEQRLIESTLDPAAQPFREFKLKQSEAIKENLRSKLAMEPEVDETGQLIQDALMGRKETLRSQKNDLYQIAYEKSREIGGVPVFTDEIKKAIPEPDIMEDLAITAEGPMRALDNLLTKYGIKDPSPQALEAGFMPTPLTVDNFERFRKTLNRIERTDPSNAVKVASSPIKQALDRELTEMVDVIGERNVPVEILEPLKEARKTVAQMKKEFSPQSLVGRIIDVKKDMVTQITDASRVYDTLARKSTSKENVNKVINSLTNAGEKGKQALASLQSSTLLDLIEAGFGTESRKISGIKTFNPTAFKRRLKNIGRSKIEKIFKNESTTLKSLKNIDKIATELIPPAGTVPKGTSSNLLDVLNALGVIGIFSKVPGASLAAEGLKRVGKAAKQGLDVKQAINAEPEVQKLIPVFERQFPSIATALGVAVTVERE